MPDTRCESNKHVSVWIGPDTAIANYTHGPTLSEMADMLFVNEAVRWDQFDLGVETSSTESDPTLADSAGAQMRALLQFGGSMSFLTPKPTDTGILKRTQDLVGLPHVKLAIVVREVIPAGQGVAPGQVVNVYRVTTDAHSHARATTGYSYSVNMRPADFAGINRIIPSATPKAVSLGQASISLPGNPRHITAMYEGVDVTCGAEYITSDASVVEVTKHGWLVPQAESGTARVWASYPGSAEMTEPLTVTVAAGDNGTGD